MIDQASGAEETPARIRKHIAQVQAKSDYSVVYVRERVTAYNRKRLIQQRVPFVVPGNQMYLPALGIDLREYFRKPIIEKSQFRPSTQAILIYALLRTSEEPLMASDLSPKLRYTAMTLSRAFDEMETAELAVSHSAGRERCLRLAGSRGDLWERAQPFLRDPVSRRRFISPTSEGTLGPRAGLSALARYSMIAEPENPAFAMSREHWKSLERSSALNEIPLPDVDALEIEIWRYPPRPYRDEQVVDPLSLYLSLKDDQDERTQAALDHMMESLPW